MPSDSRMLLQTIISLVQAETIEKRKSEVKAHPELLSRETDSLMQLLVQDAVSQEDENMHRLFKLNHILLRRCCEAGVEQTFREMASQNSALAASFKLEDELRHMEKSVQDFRLTGDPATIDDAIAVWLHIQSHPDFPSCEQSFISSARNAANGAYLLRYKRRGEMSDLNRALELSRQAAADASEDHPNLSVDLNNLGNRLRYRYQRTGHLDDLEEAIRIYKRAVAAAPKGHPNLAVYYNNLAAVIIDRYKRAGVQEDLEEAIRIFKQAVAATPEGHADLPMRLNNLGGGLANRYRRTDHLDDLQEAIRIYRHVVAATPKGHPDLPMRLNNLGVVLVDRYKRTGLLEDLDEAIRIYRQSVAATPKDHPDLPMRLSSLGIGLTDRYKRTGQHRDLEEAMNACRQSVEATPNDHPDLPMRLSCLGTCLAKSYEITSHLEDLEEAIRIYRQAVAATPKDHPDLATYLNNLSICLLDRYKCAGVQEDLVGAIRACRQVVAATPKDHPDLAMRLNNLGAGLTDHYKRSGVQEDLEEAIKTYKQVVAATPKDHPDLPMRLNNLGAGLTERYKRWGILDDLEEAIGIYKQIVASTPKDHPDLAMYLNNLGEGLTERCKRYCVQNDLEEAIRVCKQSVAATSRGHMDLALRLNSLGLALTNSYKHTRVLEDLEEAIRVYKQAVAATPEGHIDLIMYLNNLATGFTDRYQRTGLLEDLNEAIGAYKKAVAATPIDHPNLVGGLDNLGAGLANRYQRAGLIEDLNEAIQSFRQACDLGLRIAPEEAVRAGINWQRWAFRRGAWIEVVEAYGFIRVGIEKRLSFQFSRSDKSFSLGAVQGLTAQVAYAHMQLDQLPEAVEVLEQGQAQLLREAMERQRRDLARLKELGFGHLYERFTQAVERYKSLLGLTSSKTRPADWQDQVENALQDMNDSAESIRKDAGKDNLEFRFFLKSLPIGEIQKQTSGVPLIYLAATSSGGMAFIVNATSLKVVELKGLTDEALQETVKGPKDDPQLGGYLGAYAGWRDICSDANATASWLRNLEETIRWLWETAMGDMLHHMEAECIREAVLIPVGLLCLLPLHAAWTEDQSRPTGRRYALDDFTFTYAASAHALYHARHGTSRSAETLLAVENPDGTLIFSEPEVKAVLCHFQGKSTHLMRDQARKNAVIQAIGTSQVLHFSTHGLAGWQEAEGSRLMLADGCLTLVEIFGLRLDHARLAVLSACETGIPGTKLPEEVVSLPNGLMQAGVPGVIGSLWSVGDMSTSILMAQFYDLWRSQGLPAPEALRQAQIWLRDSTVEDLKCQFKAFMKPNGLRMSAETARCFFERIGWDDPKSRPFAHPFIWAAFEYTGL